MITHEQARALQKMSKARAVELGNPGVVKGVLSLRLGVDDSGRPTCMQVSKGPTALGLLWYHGCGQVVWLQDAGQPLILPDTLRRIVDLMDCFDDVLTDLIARTHGQPTSDDVPLLANTPIDEPFPVAWRRG